MVWCSCVLYFECGVQCGFELIDVLSCVVCGDGEAEVGGGWAVGVLHEREDDVLVEERLFDGLHVFLRAQGEGEDWGWVVVGLDSEVVENCAYGVDVRLQLCMSC